MPYLVNVDPLSGKYTAKSVQHPSLTGKGDSLYGAIDDLEKMLPKQLPTTNLEHPPIQLARLVGI